MAGVCCGVWGRGVMFCVGFGMGRRWGEGWAGIEDELKEIIALRREESGHESGSSRIVGDCTAQLIM